MAAFREVLAFKQDTPFFASRRSSLIVLRKKIKLKKKHTVPKANRYILTSTEYTMYARLFTTGSKAEKKAYRKKCKFAFCAG
jgi:hypothetical protein